MIVQPAVIVACSNNTLANVLCIVCEGNTLCSFNALFWIQSAKILLKKKAVVYVSKTSKAPRSAKLSIDLVWVGLFLFLTPTGPLGATRTNSNTSNPFLSHFDLCSTQTSLTYQMSFPPCCRIWKDRGRVRKDILSWPRRCPAHLSQPTTVHQILQQSSQVRRCWVSTNHGCIYLQS